MLKLAYVGRQKWINVMPNTSELSLVYGPTDKPLWETTLGNFLNEQVQKFGDKTAVVFPWQNVQFTYKNLAERSLIVARGLLEHNLKPGDFVGIFAGNRYEYLEVFLGASQIGCPVVVLNNTYTPQELVRALSQSSCKLLFVSTSLKDKSFNEHIHLVLGNTKDTRVLSELQIVTFGPPQADLRTARLKSYETFTGTHPTPLERQRIKRAGSHVCPTDVVNLQFTSGTTGAPKAAMLTHRNILNNAHHVGIRLALTPHSTLCCPPPLFHCFGLVMGFLAALAHGSAIVFPSETFDAGRTLAALRAWGCDVLLGVPTMFLAELEGLRCEQGGNRGEEEEEEEEKEEKKNTDKKEELRVRAALAAGSPVPGLLVGRLEREMGVRSVVVAYGMTETSPVSFMTEDGEQQVPGAVGTVMPHMRAKVVDRTGRVVPRGARGELCTSGYALMKGYFGNEEATREVMKVDEEGTVWMHTGDECVIDEKGVCHITGRIKDIIIRGGENIFPAEIEERLLAHAMVAEACVVGIRDEKYGEVVGCFLRPVRHGEKVETVALQEWVRESLGRHKAPQWVFWIGDPAVGDDYPKTGSGKHQKHILRELGNRLVSQATVKARL